jgi:uncharacterized RDD family membrane protein YckC
MAHMLRGRVAFAAHADTGTIAMIVSVLVPLASTDQNPAFTMSQYIYIINIAPATHARQTPGARICGTLTE